MKKLLIILVVLIVTLLLPACSTGAGKARIGEEFSLKVGESAEIQGKDLKITFLEVLEDSRCPKNVTCVWEGRARSLVRITSSGNSEDIELDEPGLSDQPNQYDYSDYRINFHLMPYPENAGESPEYYLLLTITNQ